MVRTVWSSMLIIILLSVFCAPVASALTEDEVIHFFQNIYNPHVDEIIPDIPLIKSVFGGQVIHIIIEKQGGNIELSAVTDPDGYITELESGIPDSPTLRLISNEAVVQRIRNSDDPVAETNEALISGDITYEGVGVKQEISVTIVKIVYFFADLFCVI
jgi:hypothetical protein